MDRLICGDVGYGKTEVAMRAAFKAVDAGKQVAVLVPTTILAEQHHRSFTQRMAEFPFTIEVVNRFRPKSEIKDVLKRTAAGAVDILIGTHRLVQKDVAFKDLGPGRSSTRSSGSASRTRSGSSRSARRSTCSRSRPRRSPGRCT